jgi:REP element-mobilizing transposase RayT
LERTELTNQQHRARIAAKKKLKFPEVKLSSGQINAVACGFQNAIAKSGLTIWACSILPQHVHLVIARHHFAVEQIVNLMKGEATKQLRREGLHPMESFTSPDNRLPSPWADRKWKVYLDSEESIDNAIDYVRRNPLEDGQPEQDWEFVQPFTGLDTGWVTYM